MAAIPVRPSLGDTIENVLGRRPDHVAVVDDERALTFGALADEVSRGSAELRRLGLVRGSRVAYRGEASIDALVLDLVCLVHGYVRVPINPRAHQREAVDMVQRSSAGAFLDGSLAAAEQRMLLRECPALVAVGAFESAQFHGEVAPRSAFSDNVSDAHDRPAAIAFTSGTTGVPKGAIHSADALLSSALVIAAEVGILADDVAYLPLPLSNIGAHFALAFLIRGATVVLSRRWSPKSFVEAHRKSGANVLFCVPTMLRGLLPLAHEFDAGAIRRIVYGATPTPADDVVRTREAFGDVLTQLYGQTEVGMVSALGVADHHFDPGERPPARLASSGRPVAGACVRVVGVDDAALPAGERGEIVVASPSAMTAYLDDPQATAAACTADGFIKTGDVGVFDTDGYLSIIGRTKDVIISGGYNVYPLEVEAVIRTLETIEDVAVLGLPDEQWGEVVAAVVVWGPGAEEDPERVRSHCRGYLAGYKVPKRVYTLTALPRNTSGKVDKARLRAAVGAAPSPVSAGGTA